MPDPLILAHEPQLLPCEGKKIGRVAMVIDEKWAIDIATELVSLGYEILRIPGWRHVKNRKNGVEALEQQIELAAHLEAILSTHQPIDFIFDNNGNLILADVEGKTIMGERLGIKTVCWWLDDPRYSISDLINFDLISMSNFLKLLASPSLIHLFIDESWSKEFGTYYDCPHCYHLPAAASHRVFSPKDTKKEIPVIFIGNHYLDNPTHLIKHHSLSPWVNEVLAPAYQAKQTDPTLDLRSAVQKIGSKKANEFLKIISSPFKPGHFDLSFSLWQTNTLLWSGLRNRLIQTAANQLNEQFVLYGLLWERTPLGKRPFLNGNSAMANQLNRAEIGINGIHGQEQTGLPVRIFEHAAVGLPTITQSSRELSRLFEPDSEVIELNEPKAVVEEIKALSADQKKQKSLRKNFHARFLKDHTWHTRVNQMLTLLNENQHLNHT